MINGYCRTNLDEYDRVKWPKVFAEIPKKGDYVESIDRKYRLKVHTITHGIKENKNAVGYLNDKYVPYIEVELNK